ncbi:MAG: molybdopterin-binding protein [Pseudomonadota bacterium]
MIGLHVVGDELLSGKRQDKHLPAIISLLAARGMSLGYARFLGDDETQIAEAISAARDQGDVLLSCGGIGATPDDCTRQAAARAFGVPLQVHAEALALIEIQYGAKAHPNRALMAEFPEGAELIPNPVNRVAGFSMGHCYFVPGFPEMAWPMLEWVLDHRLRHLHNAEPPVEFSLRALGAAKEGDLLDLMNRVLAEFPGVKLSSLPFRGNSAREPHIEFGIKGPHEQAAKAFVAFRGWLALRWERLEDLKIP